MLLIISPFAQHELCQPFDSCEESGSFPSCLYFELRLKISPCCLISNLFTSSQTFGSDEKQPLLSLLQLRSLCVYGLA